MNSGATDLENNFPTENETRPRHGIKLISEQEKFYYDLLTNKNGLSIFINQ